MYIWKEIFFVMMHRFLDYLATEKRYSAHTILSYTRDLNDFKAFCLETESTEDLETINKRGIRNFMMMLSEKGLGKRSINRKISALRSFYSFLMKIGTIGTSPMEGIESLKVYPEKQIPMSVEEMEQLQSQWDEKPDVLSELIIEVLYQTGMRKAELCGLLLQNVNLDIQELRIIGKGNKTRIVPISDELSQKMKNYLKHRKPIETSAHLFFVNEKGKKLTEKFVYIKVSSYLSLVTSKEKKSPHILRHSFATHVLDNGAEISKVQKILGHVSLASTQVYTHANLEQLKKVYATAHPRAIKKIK